MAEEKGYELRVTEDGMKACVTVDSDAPSFSDVSSAVVDEAAQRGLEGVPSAEKLTSLFSEAYEKNGEVRDVAICSGTAPTPPQDGQIVWARDFFSTDFVKDEYGRVNYHERKGNPSVYQGEWIATVYPAKEGTGGVDVCGGIVPPKHPKEVSLKAGNQVTVESEGGEGEAEADVYHYYAAIDGRVHYDNDTLDVHEEFVVKSDVGKKTGDISHPGSVIVKGDVTPGSSVETEGDLEVDGTIEQADVAAGGNLEVKEGITGKGKSPIRAGGMVTARYIREAEVEAEGQVSAVNEIISSDVYTRGKADLSEGRLAGGELTALQGAKIKELGSEGASVTTLKVAIDPFLEKRIAPLQEEIDKNQGQIDKIYQKAGPQLRNQKNLSAKQREAVTELLGKITELETAIEEAREKIKKVKQESEEKARQGATHIEGTIFPESYIQVDDTPLERIAEKWHGPIRLTKVPDEDAGGHKIELIHEGEAK